MPDVESWLWLGTKPHPPHFKKRLNDVIAMKAIAVSDPDVSAQPNRGLLDSDWTWRRPLGYSDT